MGTPFAYARSMTRMIFSTVRAPQDPALTVESLAITQTSRPPIRALPVITPSAGSPSARLLAYSPSSTKEPSSVSSAMRSRANSLPLAALAAWYRSAPPAIIRLRIWPSASPSTVNVPPRPRPERSLG
jgi:hypothetical protein